MSKSSALSCFASALALFLLAATPAAADVLVLADGRVLERSGMERVEGGVKVHFDHGDVIVPSELIEETILPNQPPPEPKTPEEKEKYEKGYVKFQGDWVKPDKRDRLIQKRLEERRAYVEQIREHRQWRRRYKEETKHFEFEYNVAPHVFEYFRDLMEAYYDEFAKTWKIRQPHDLGKLKVCFYSNLDQFHQIGGVGGGIQGYFRFVKPLELNFYLERLDIAHSEQVMYHEACHYLQLLQDPNFDTPHFLGESLAEYYGASKYDHDKNKLETGLVLEGRLVEIKNDIAAGEMLPLEKMMTTPRMYEHYTWGWSFVHFLMNHKQYRKKYEKFVKGMVSGKGVDHVREGPNNMETVRTEDMWNYFKEVFHLRDEEDVKALESEWHTYVKENLKLVTASGLEKAAQGAMRTGRPIRAKRLFQEAIDKGTKNPMTYYSFASLVDGDQRIELLKRAIELAPLEGRFYARLGQAMLEKDAEEGKRLLQLGLDIDPEIEGEIKELLEAAGD